MEWKTLEGGERVDVQVKTALIIPPKRAKNLDPILETPILPCMKLPGIETRLMVDFHVIQLNEGVKP